MNELKLAKSVNFGNVQCDIYRNESDLLMTREQIGIALEYANPKKAIEKLHLAHVDRFSVTPQSGGHLLSLQVKLIAADGKTYDTTVYTRKGVMEICRWSQQPKANAFMDFVWDTMDDLMTGKKKIVDMTEYQRLIAQSRMENARLRKARILEQLADKYEGTYRQVLHSYATKELTGEHLIPLPSLNARTYSAGDIAKTLGISANMVGRLTNEHKLKTTEYGAWFNDKAKGHNKEVQSFRYYENVIPALRQIIQDEEHSGIRRVSKKAPNGLTEAVT